MDIEQQPNGSGSHHHYHNDSTNNNNNNSHTQSHHSHHHNHHLPLSFWLLAVSFAILWTSCNLMAPNLTIMATDFGFTTSYERDLYLGSYIILVFGIASIPLATLLGILADVVAKRNYLLAAILLVSGGSCFLTGSTWCSSQYSHLLFLRWINGACLSGSIPIVFSIVGDLIISRWRILASSILTMSMGVGMFVGQVLAGIVTSEWQWSFRVSGVATLCCAVVCALCLEEPQRGSKEHVLQSWLEQVPGTVYTRQLTRQTIWQAIFGNASNLLLLWQGFSSSLPWGIIMVFLNDYLAQECQFTVKEATFMVSCFGVGCALGGVLGGVVGQVLYERNRVYLPIFMALSTIIGIVPFVLILHVPLQNAHGFVSIFLTMSGGCLANLPSVHLRPMLLHVNLPEARGVVLTVATMWITLGRGLGPSMVTAMMRFLDVDRTSAFTISVSSVCKV